MENYGENFHKVMLKNIKIQKKIDKNIPEETLKWACYCGGRNMGGPNKVAPQVGGQHMLVDEAWGRLQSLLAVTCSRAEQEHFNWNS